MKVEDLKIITQTAKIFPDLLPHILNIYQLGYKQAQIDIMKSRLKDDSRWGINYGSEMKPNN